jgi:excisionase family DNA binding protein
MTVQTPTLFTRKFVLPPRSRTLNIHLTVMDRITVQEAAQRLGISQDAVRQRVRRGSMRHEKDDKGRVYVYLSPTNTRSTIVHDTPRDTVGDTVHDASPNELLKELRDRIHFLEIELGDRKEESRRKDHIIAALTQRIPELEPTSEQREYSERPTEHVDRGTTDSGTDRGTTRISTTECRRPRWAFLLRELVSASRRVRRGIRRG